MKRIRILFLFVVVVGLLPVVAGMDITRDFSETRLLQSDSNGCVYSGTGYDFDHYSSIDLDLTDVNDATLCFWTMYTIIEPNTGYVQVSEDDGVSWDVLAEFKGFQYDWAQVSINLDEYVGKEICLAFYYDSYNNVVDLGWYIDSILIDAHWRAIYSNDFEHCSVGSAWGNFTVIEKQGPPPMIANQFFDEKSHIHFFNTSITDDELFTKTWAEVLYYRTEVPNENTYFLKHSYVEDTVDIGISMWSYLRNGSITLFDVFTLSSVIPYHVCVFAEPMNSVCSIDNIHVDVENGLITADVQTNADVPWWGCFVLQDADMPTELKALSDSHEWALIENENYSVNYAGSLCVVAVEILPEYEQMQLTFETDSGNHPPDKPTKPSGQISGKVGVEYTYTTTAFDEDDDEMWFKWDWGDGTFSDWVGPYTSRSLVETSHTWVEKDDYQIRVKAKDEHGQESIWSDPLSVSMPKAQIYHTIPDMILKLCKHFPLFQLYVIH